MFYTIYKITNLIDGKIYIGKHQTKDLNDGYMGSGKQLKRAQAKHGIENFKKEILFQFDNEADMNTKEAELVTEEFCLREDTYNLCPGGKGGWGYVNVAVIGNDHRRSVSVKGANTTNTRRLSDQEFAEYLHGARSRSASERLANGTLNRIDPKAFLGRKHTEETKEKMRKSKNVGSSNSQFGTMWITNGQENKKIRTEETIPNGWTKGMTAWHKINAPAAETD